MLSPALKGFELACSLARHRVLFPLLTESKPDDLAHP
jgi:hypothetical protein